MTNREFWAKRISYPQLLVAGTFAIIGILVVLVDLSVWVAVLTLICVLGVAFLRYRLAFTSFIFILFAWFDLSGYLPLLNEPIKIYLADGVAILLLVTFLKVLSGKISRNRLVSPISSLLIINFFWGIVPLIVGFENGYPWNEVLGDFRRLFFYPLVTFVSLSYIFKSGDILRLLRLFAIALLMIGIIAITRVITGQTWDPEQFVPQGDFRAVGYFTGTIVVMGIGVFYGLSLVSQGRWRWILLLATALLIGVGFLSGYRLLWVFLIIVPLFVSFATYPGLRRTLKLIITLIVILMLVVGVLFVLQELFPSWFLLMKAKFQERVLEFSFEKNIRYYAWHTAWNRFLGSPIIGVGIGDQFSFWAISSAGQPHLFKLTTHNVLLTILYQTGIIGASLFILIHLRVFWYIWRKLPKVELQSRAPIAGMLGGYLAILGLGMFQPLFDSPGAIVATYIWIGLMLNIMKDQYRKRNLHLIHHNSPSRSIPGETSISIA